MAQHLDHRVVIVAVVGRRQGGGHGLKHGPTLWTGCVTNRQLLVGVFPLGPHPSTWHRGARCYGPTMPIETDVETELPDGEMIEDELLVEEISIDGMCGVY